MNNVLHKVLLADNQPLTTAGLIYFLSSSTDIEIIDQVNHHTDLIELIFKHQPDLLIADYNIPGYVTISDLQEVSKVSRHTNTLIISSDNTKTSIMEVASTWCKRDF